MPEPGYLSAVVPHVVGDARAVVVGARRTGAEDTEPQWLIDAWSATANLRDADHSSWRYVISAVLTCSREFFDAVGGFDGKLVMLDGPGGGQRGGGGGSDGGWGGGSGGDRPGSGGSGSGDHWLVSRALTCRSAAMSWTRSASSFSAKKLARAM